MISNNEEQKNISVLIIEDNYGDFVLIEDYLLEKFKGVERTHCKDCKTAIEFLESEEAPYSVILLDLHLPDLDGISLIKKILSHSFHTPIIILTGYSDIGLAQKSLQLGVYDFLLKDEINPTLLHKSIEFTINRRRYIKEIKDEKFNYESLFNFSPQPMWLLDSETLNILNANFAAIVKYGYSLKAIRKMSFLQFHPSEERDEVKKELTSKDKDSKNRHYTHILKDGTEIKVDLYCGELKSTSKLDSVIVQSTDITETLTHINTIEIQNEKLRSIAWTQSHIVRAPLSRILGIINLIDDKKESPEEILFWLNQLRISANEMDEVVKKIVKESRHLKYLNENKNIYN